MKKISIILVLILIIFNFNSCSTYLRYFMNKKNTYEYTYFNPNNSLDTLSTIYAISNNPPKLDSISVINIEFIPKVFSKIIYNETEVKLKYKKKYFKLSYDKFLGCCRSNDYYKFAVNKRDYETKDNKIRFSFEPGLKEGDTLTLFTNGILTYENGTKILPDSINIIVPD